MYQGSEMEIRHWSHEQHPLLLSKDKILNDQLTCGVCGRHNITAPLYACETCKYYVEKSCAELPNQINHSFHPRHPLILTQRSARCICDSCLRDFRNTYCCRECNFDMDVECAQMPNFISSCPEGQQCIQHSSHPHLLLLRKNMESVEYCFACENESAESSLVNYNNIYGCSRCSYFLHQQCLDQLPQTIKHPFHPHHDILILRARRNRQFECKLCENYYENTFMFDCCSCDYKLCVSCGTSSLKPIIKYEVHEHPLFLIETEYSNRLECDSYDNYCKLPVISRCKELNFNNSMMFRCIDCNNFRIHLLCGLLPFTIKHKCHIHPFILVDFLLEDDEEHYCDICEAKRDPRVRVYYCKECKYVAHVVCLIDEIIKVLRGDHPGNVELKTIAEDAWKSTSQENEDQAAAMSLPLTTFKDLLDKLTEDELWWFKRRFYWDASSSEDNKERDQEVISTQNDELIRDEDIDELLQFSNFTEREYKNLVSIFSTNFYKRKLETKSRDLKLKVVDVKGGYKVPFVVAPVLRKILDIYGDITQRFRLSLEMKSIMLFFVCKVTKEIHTTFYTDITKRLLLDWYHYVQFVNDYNFFKIGFLEALLEKRTRAFFCLQLHKLEMDAPKLINKKIDQLQKQMEEQKARLEEQKARLELCNKFRQSSSKPEFVKECLKEATELKRKTKSKDPF